MSRKEPVKYHVNFVRNTQLFIRCGFFFQQQK